MEQEQINLAADYLVSWLQPSQQELQQQLPLLLDHQQEVLLRQLQDALHGHLRSQVPHCGLEVRPSRLQIQDRIRTP